MSFHDRDYARSRPLPTHGLGKLRMLSFNTWIIIINVAVYLVSNQMLSDTGFIKNLVAPNTPIDVRVDFGKVYRADVKVTQEDIAKGVVDPNIRVPLPELPGSAFGNPIINPEKLVVDEQKRVVVDRVTGAPLPFVIGYQREGFLPPLYAFGHFSTAKAFGMEAWRFLTFQFLHFNAVHLLFNMFGLWFVGGLVEQYLGSRRYAVFYLASGAAGAMMYLFLNLMGNLLGIRLPGLLFNDVYTPLIGASAGVFSVLVAAAYIQPHAIVQVYFVIPMKLRTAVYGLMGITLINLLTGSKNAGGEAAHVGGALAGYYLIRHTHLLRTVFGLLGSGPIKTSRDDAFAAAAGPGGRSRADANWAQIDRVVAKADAQGLSSLTPAEKRVLQRAKDLLNET